MLQSQLDRLRQENDVNKQKLEDFERLSSFQSRSISSDTTRLEQEIRSLKQDIADMEKSHKSEVSQMRMRHDSRILQLNHEIATLRQQFSKAGRERDTFRDMLDGAQKTISDLRHEGKAAKEQTFEHKMEETYQDQIQELQERLTTLEDELSDSRMENVKVSSDMAADRAHWQLKIVQLQTR
ncbi:unnamed protein product, partial [Notodromas monacha]